MRMTYIWSGMILLGIVFAALHGTLPEVTDAVLSSSKEAVTLCISMAGITAMWTGIMKIAENTGLVKRLCKTLRPVLRFLFPDLPDGSAAHHYISLNFLSNILGLGWGSTASGLMAFRELDRLNGPDKGRASTAMCTFLIINVSSLQLIPVNMIAYRAQYGSPAPAAVVGPSVIATAVSTLAAVLFCIVIGRREGKNK